MFAIANGCQRSYCTFVRTLRVRQLGCKIISQLVHSIHSHSFTHSHSQQQINGKSNSDTVAHMRIESIVATLNFCLLAAFYRYRYSLWPLMIFFSRYHSCRLVSSAHIPHFDEIYSQLIVCMLRMLQCD